jgi:hypothetical protein
LTKFSTFSGLFDLVGSFLWNYFMNVDGFKDDVAAIFDYSDTCENFFGAFARALKMTLNFSTVTNINFN